MYPKGIVRAGRDRSSDDIRLTVSTFDGVTCAGRGGSRWISGKGICLDMCEASFDSEVEASGARPSSRALKKGLEMSSVPDKIGKGASGCVLAGLDARVSLGDPSK